jgi:hypothetical protein
MSSKKIKKTRINMQPIEFVIMVLLLVLIFVGLIMYMRLNTKSVDIDKQPLIENRSPGQ